MKITTIIKIVGAMLSFLLLLIIVVTLFLLDRQIKDANVVNIAGRERMLTQQISKELYYAMLVRKLDKKDLQVSLLELRSNFDDLLHGNEERGIYAPQTPELEKELVHINGLLGRFENSIDNFSNDFLKSLNTYNELNLLNQQLLEVSETITELSVSLETSGDIVNRAGKQRMLTQKMARIISEFFSLRDTNSYRELYTFFGQYQHTLNIFFNNPILNQDKNAVALLKENSGLYQEYRKLSDRFYSEHNALSRQIEFIYEFNTVLLSAFNSAVVHYASHSDKKKEFLEIVQLIAGVIALLFVLIAFISLNSIIRQFEIFSKTTDALKDEANIQCERASELEQATIGIGQFAKKIDQAILHAKQAVLESENAAKELGVLSEEMETLVHASLIEAQNIEEIDKVIDRSEDIAIQSVEELHATSELLEKLHNNLNTLMQQVKQH